MRIYKDIITGNYYSVTDSSSLGDIILPIRSLEAQRNSDFVKQIFFWAISSRPRPYGHCLSSPKYVNIFETIEIVLW